MRGAAQNTLGVHGDVTQQFYFQSGDDSPCNPCLQQYNFVVTEFIQDVGSVGRCDWCARPVRVAALTLQ